MKIIPAQKSEYGNFSLQPESGWEITHSFKDLESGLLVVRTGLIDTSHLKPEKGILSPPHHEYIIDQRIPAILDFEGWKKYFVYDKVISFSEDKKLELHTQRYYEQERHSDFIKEVLYETGSGKRLSESDSVAFSDQKRHTLIESHYEHQKHEEEYRKCLEKGEYSWDLHLKYLRSLKKGEMIFEFEENGKFLLRLEAGLDCVRLFSAKIERGKEADFYHEDNYNCLMGFWNELTKDQEWYLKHSPRGAFHPAMQYYIITFHNRLVDKTDLSLRNYRKLHEWMNAVYSSEIHQSLLWQFCPHCHDRVYYSPRYPKAICRYCRKKLKDNYGNPVDFHHTHELKYHQGVEAVILKAGGESVKIFIDATEYVATEARFGGIAIQKKSAE